MVRASNRTSQNVPGFVVAGTGVASFSSNSASLFASLFSSGTIHTAEANAQFTIDSNWLLKRFEVKVNANNKSGDTVFWIRDDGADVAGTSLTVAAGSTTVQISNVLNIRVNAGHEVSMRVDTSASASGSLGFTAYIQYIPYGGI